MQTLFNIVVLVVEFVGIGTVVTVCKDVVKMRKERKAEAAERAKEIATIQDGIKCQLRSELLRTYYHCQDTETIRQYELENFIALYNAYVALGGNSFIHKIFNEVMTYSVTT